MTYLLLQTFLLLSASYFLGAFLACTVKRTFFARRATAAARQPLPAKVIDPSPAAAVVSEPRVARPARPARVEARTFDPVQPKIEVFKRPEPHPMPKLIDPKRFEQALFGPDPNEGMPRRALVEVRPAILKSPTVTGEKSPPPAAPPKPAPVAATKPVTPTPAPSIAKIVAQEVAQQRREAPVAPIETAQRKPLESTTAAGAAAVAAAKAAAAASVMPAAAAAKPEPQTPAPAPAVTPPPSPANPAAPPPVGMVNPTAPAFKLPDPPITEGDDFQRIRAIDFVTEQKLKSIGVLYFDHIAGWTGNDVKRIGQQLDISGRADREQWIEQAQILAKGGETYYSRNRAGAQKAATDNPAVTQAATSPAVLPVPDSQNAKGAASPPASSAVLPSASLPKSSATEGKSVAEMAHAAAAAIAAASASVTRGLKPIEPISPLAKADPKISMPAKLSDAIKERAAESKPAPLPSSDAPPPSIKQAAGGANDLKRIRGIGVLSEKRLNGAGVTRYEHIANWTAADIDRFSQLLEFKGRIERENWIEQARILASGAHTEFSRRFDRGEVDLSKES